MTTAPTAAERLTEQADDHGKTQLGDELPIQGLADLLTDHAMDQLLGGARMFGRVEEQFIAGGMSWDEMAETVDGVSAHLFDVVQRDIYIRQYRDADNALAVIRVLVDDTHLVGALKLPEHAIMKAPSRPKGEASDE